MTGCAPGSAGEGEFCTEDIDCCTQVCTDSSSCKLLVQVVMLQHAQRLPATSVGPNSWQPRLQRLQAVCLTGLRPERIQVPEQLLTHAACSPFCTGGAACFSAESTVNILELPVPVTMRDLKTGQHVECMESGEDFMAPRTTQYCEVTAWVRLNMARTCILLGDQCHCSCGRHVYM
jgi:hypothetical protein